MFSLGHTVFLPLHHRASTCCDFCDDAVVERDSRMVWIALSGVGMMVMTVGRFESGG